MFALKGENVDAISHIWLNIRIQNDISADKGLSTFTQEAGPDMTLQNQIKAWVVMLAVFILFMWVFRGILLPFIAGMILAYLLDPVADLLEKIKFSRFWATLTILVVAVAFFIGLFLFIVPPLINQLVGLVARLPEYISQLQVFATEYGNKYAPTIIERLGEERAAEFQQWLNQLLNQGIGFAVDVTTRVAQSGLTLLNALGLMIVTPVVAFYLLLDWDQMVKRIDELLPREHRKEIQYVFGEIDVAMAGFVRGQSSVVMILAAFYATALTLVDLNFGLAIGLAAGFFSFIPYVGFLVGFVLSIGVAIVQFWPDWFMVGVVFGIFMVGQFIEGNILYPKLVGRSIGVHAVWLMFALFAFALLFGAVGVLLAVPMAAIAGVLGRYAVKKYLESPLYDASNGPKPKVMPSAIAEDQEEASKTTESATS
ncbi:AI-2E family transporter [Maritalea porphyrae]|uniref:AI-2E family transporter n=3 Tax=Maritalea porphyrae TaxID=880732 RepID=A0ABQ5UTT1_9HYPH|nr:AI-2E family transporter [Maritalea porphyrae]